MRFWDSSAVVPLVVAEIASDQLGELADDATPMYVWWATRVEVTAAVARRERADVRRDADWSACFRSLNEEAETWREVGPADLVRQIAERMLRRHDLRAGDSLQLAAALIACDDRPAGQEFVCLDDRLRRAAAIEGFSLLPP